MYRYSAEAKYDEEGIIFVGVKLHQYRVTSVTTYTMRLVLIEDAQIVPSLCKPPKRCSRFARVMWAWPTPELAFESLKFRREWRLWYLKRQLKANEQLVKWLGGIPTPPKAWTFQRISE